MTGENFIRMNRKSKGKMLIQELEQKRTRIWDEYTEFLKGEITQRIDYVRELKRIAESIETIKWEMRNGYRQ